MSDRKTEFRGRGISGGWYYGEYAKGRIYTKDGMYRNIWEKTVGQNTGACDFQHSEIFEDDVVVFNISKKANFFEDSYPYVIIYDEEEYRFMLESLDGKFVRLPLAMFSHKEIEIQGTIFDDEFREEYLIHNRTTDEELKTEYELRFFEKG